LLYHLHASLFSFNVTIANGGEVTTKQKNRQVYPEYTKPAGYTIVMAKEPM